MSQNSDFPLISIAMATYNGGKYIEEQLDSIYNQTYPNLEVVVCDDGSTDNTPEILNRYVQEKGLRFYPNPERLGYIKNFERAMGLCEGEFIALSDQDDVWLPEKLQTLYDNIGENLLIHGDLSIVSPTNEMVQESAHQYYFKEEYPYIFLDAENQRRFQMTRKSLCQGCTFLMRRKLMEISLPFPETEIHDLWLPFVAGNEHSIKYLPLPLTRWRLHGNNTSQQNNKTSLLKRMLVGSPVHTIHRRYRYFKRANLLKERGFVVGGYPLKMHEERY